MDVMHAKCAGLDVHQQTVVACARLAIGRSVTYDVRTFGTTTRELLALTDGLTAHGCTHVAMESTGVYSRRRRPIDHHARDQRNRGARRRRRDRIRHGPLPDRRPPRLVGRSVPPAPRKRRQAALQSNAPE